MPFREAGLDFMAMREVFNISWVGSGRVGSGGLRT